VGKHHTSFQGSITDAISDAIRGAISDARIEVVGGDGHYRISVVSSQFAGKTMIESHRLVYSAIAPLMTGNDAPVHAVDSLTTQTP
jgi:stress-induced morphogen